MPGVSGWDGLRELRAEPATRDIPIIVLSGLSDNEDHAVNSEVSGWIQKPFDADQLCAAIAAVSKRHRQLVLLVEDDPDLARVISSTLEQHGVELVSAFGANQAKAAVTRRAPDLVILDLALADGDGFEVVNYLRQHDRLRNVSLVVYSATEVERDDQEKLRLGPTEFLTKARVTPEQLEALVLHLLRADSERKALNAQAGTAGR
jgi:DNA-binding response OmpR family regulator